jgi:hypothetical protein
MMTEEEEELCWSVLAAWQEIGPRLRRWGEARMPGDRYPAPHPHKILNDSDIVMRGFPSRHPTFLP